MLEIVKNNVLSIIVINVKKNMIFFITINCSNIINLGISYTNFGGVYCIHSLN